MSVKVRTYRRRVIKWAGSLEFFRIKSLSRAAFETSTIGRILVSDRPRQPFVPATEKRRHNSDPLAERARRSVGQRCCYRILF